MPGEERTEAKPKGKQPVCQKAVNAVVSAQPVSTSRGHHDLSATLGGLPYGQTVVLRAVVTNAARACDRRTRRCARWCFTSRPSRSTGRPSTHSKHSKHKHNKH